VALLLRDLDTGRAVLSAQAAPSVENRMMELFGGLSVDVAMHRDTEHHIEVGVLLQRVLLFFKCTPNSGLHPRGAWRHANLAAHAVCARERCACVRR
jgi:hypothetical protein